MNTILKLWNGEISHEELLSRKEDSKQNEQREKEVYEKFWNSLTKEQRKLYLDFEIYGNEGFYKDITTPT